MENSLSTLCAYTNPSSIQLVFDWYKMKFDQPIIPNNEFHNFFLTIRLWTSSTPTFENRIKLKIAKSCDLGFVTSGERFTSRACALRKTCHTVASFRARYIDANSKGGFTTSYSIEKVNVIRDPAIYGHHRSRFVLMIACNTVFAHLVNRY